MSPAVRHWSGAELVAAAGFGVGLAMILLMPSFVAGDALAYYRADFVPTYSGVSGNGLNFLYSPVASELLEPLRIVPFDVFAFLVRLAGVVSLVYVAREFTLPLLLAIPVLVDNPVVMELWYGNINLILAAVAVAGLRRSGLWAIPLLTKVTPGLGILWFAVRGEWRKAALPVAIAGALTLASVLISPGAWAAWIADLVGPHDPIAIAGAWGGLPFGPRLVAAALLIAWGARTSRPWTVVVATWLSIPVLWPQTLSVLTPLPRMALQSLAARRIDRNAPPALYPRAID